MERTEALLHLKSGEVTITSGVLRSESPCSESPHGGATAAGLNPSVQGDSQTGSSGPGRKSRI